MPSKVFLGGTCNDSTWREELIALLTIDYYDPVVPDWTSECQQEEIRQRGLCDYCLYTITPRMTGVYAIAEAVDDSHKRPEKTIFCILERDGDLSFSSGQMRSLQAVGRLIERNGGRTFMDLRACAEYLNDTGGKGNDA